MAFRFDNLPGRDNPWFMNVDRILDVLRCQYALPESQRHPERVRHLETLTSNQDPSP